MSALPNGLAFGGSGQLEEMAAGGAYFGLWLHDGLETGESIAPCATFGSPQLSAKPKFAVRHVELWAVAEDPPEPEAPPPQPEWITSRE